ncbi:MAG TPA: hypothetical protein VNV85_08950 [Puia sp.]|jgi:hypothetical protein|nr:hypothetical protein [Puia sp.]
MKLNSSLPEIDAGKKPKSPKARTERSGKNKLQDAPADQNDLQSLNDKAKESPFSNYYKAKNNDPL